MPHHDRAQAPAHANGRPEPSVRPAQFWDEMYSAREQVWSGRVNGGLASRVAGMRPGRALDLGCGEGADAIWLARAGWRVTAVDISAVAVARAEEHARRAGVSDRVVFETRDLTASLPPGPFDLVSAQYFQTPLAQDLAAILGSAAALVAPDGAILVVSHAAPPPWARSDHSHDEFPTPAGIVADLHLDDAWRLAEAGIVEREATGPEGQSGILLDCVVRAIRRAPEAI